MGNRWGNSGNSVKLYFLGFQNHWMREAGSIPGREDPLEEGKATHSSILAWKIPWTEKPGRLQSMGSQRVGHD